MTKSRSTFVIEGIVMVASILLAFGIDAWWDDRRAVLDEREHIAQLTFDFQVNATRLANIRSIHEAALDLLETLGQLADKPRAALPWTLYLESLRHRQAYS